MGSPPTNFFDCTLKKDLGVLDAGVFKYPLSEEIAKTVAEAPSNEMILGVRPQSIQVYREKREQATVEAELYVSEPLGDVLILNLKVEDILFKAVVNPDFKADVGEKFWVEFRAEKVYLFDRKTGEALT
ncbi:MAG: TOBE domain-containing protein [Candidatus Bathyarchaeota archaeon]|nr:TOBE domain-containing protein [Candidatus Bathyarchaeota archaeon]